MHVDLLRQFVRTCLLENKQAADYLISINLDKLTKLQKPSSTDDKRTFYTLLQGKAQEGPIFSSRAIEKIYSLQASFSKPFVKWLGLCLKKSEDSHDYGLYHSTRFNSDSLKEIEDWARATNEELSDRLSFNTAVSLSDEWHEQFKKQKVATGKFESKDVVFNCSDGYTIVKVTSKHDLDLEGAIMQHCVGSYFEEVRGGRTEVLSLRDPNNRPHVTIELQNGVIEQVQGKQNTAPVQKYLKYLEEFFVGKNLISSKTVKYITDSDLLRQLTKANNRLIRLAVSQSDHTPTDALRTLAGDEDSSIRSWVALNPNTPLDVFEILSNDDHTGVRSFVAQSKHTPGGVLEKLSTDPNIYVRRDVAKNTNTPGDVLEILSTNVSDSIRLAVAENIKTPKEVLIKLRDDHEIGISSIASATLIKLIPKYIVNVRA